MANSISNPPKPPIPPKQLSNKLRFLATQEYERADFKAQANEMGKLPLERVAELYDPFFYRQLSRRARWIYLFRDEYIFDVEKGVVVETPQLGHATYVFAKPRSMDSFLDLYIRTKKDDIRRNRDKQPSA